MLESLLSGNERFVKNVFERNPKVFSPLKQGQTPKVLWFGCSDSRIVPELVTTATPGSLYVQSNHGNIVVPNDASTGAVLEYSLGLLRVKLIVVCGHYDCDGVKDAFGAKSHLGVFLRNTVKAKTSVQKALAKKKARIAQATLLKLIAEANVLNQIEHLYSYPDVAEAIPKGVEVAGLVYDVETGRLVEGYPELSRLGILEEVRLFLK